MVESEDAVRPLWDLAVLACLHEAPMHPYEIQRLLRERHKDELLVLKRGSLYHSINRLTAAELIEPVGTERDGRRPERTTYQVTPQGSDALVDSVRQMVALPRREASEFFAGLSFLVYLTPDDAATSLERRIGRLTAEVDELSVSIRKLAPLVARINVLEEEYLLAMRRAELKWARSVLDEVRSGRLTWNLSEILDAARAPRQPPAGRNARA